MIFYFENKSITLQEDSNSMIYPKWKVRKFFATKESHSIKSSAKRIKHILDTEYKKINLENIVK